MNAALPDFVQYCKTQHDVVCNQKYDNRHPYSFHLELVSLVRQQFQSLIPIDDPYHTAVIAGCWGHDLIEDARVTYNDILAMTNNIIADIIYACTEEKGKNRGERHNEKYFQGLVDNDLATFVKLCDIIANVKYSLLTNSSMYDKYRKEFPHLKEKLGVHTQYKPMFDYLERLLNVK